MLARLYRDGGQTITLGLPPIGLPLGRGIGGTTLINSGTCFRTPQHVLERWRGAFGLELDEDSLAPCFARVERALSVAEVTPELAGRNAAVIRRGAERLGWSHGYLKRNAKGCVGSGVCAFGCPTSAKQHTGITYVPRARSAGATVLTGADARRVLVHGRRSAGVLARTADGRDLEVRARLVVIAAGTIHTPILLARSGLGAASGQLGRNLSLHPATAAVARMEERVDMARGVPQSFYVDEFAPEGIMLETIAGPPAYVAMSLPLIGRRHADAMAAYPYLAQIGLMVCDGGRGEVRSLGRGPLIRYDLGRAEVERFRAGIARLDTLLRAAGAREVYLPLPPGMVPARARPRDLKLMAFHPAWNRARRRPRRARRRRRRSRGPRHRRPVRRRRLGAAERSRGQPATDDHGAGHPPRLPPAWSDMSFLIDPALLYSSGRAYGQLTRSTPHAKRDAAFGAATMAVFWGVSIPLYLDHRWTRPIWRACRARSGRDWMLNSGVTRLDARGAGAATHAVAAAIFAAYPYWLWRGIQTGRG